MRKLTLLLPILALSACSVIEQPYLPAAGHTVQGQYGQGCGGACASGQGYSVTGQQNAGYTYGQPMAQSGPVHVNPTGHGAYGQQYGHGYGAGHVSNLRGMHGQKQSKFYTTLGGVMYDTDVNSFGLEGRLGYDFGPRAFGTSFGIEVEGSVGLNDETKTSAADVETKTGFGYNVAAFGINRLPITQKFSLHSRVGYDFRNMKVVATDALGGTASAKVKFDGLAYGLGGEYALNPKSALRLDFTEYKNEIGATQSVSASYKRKF